MKKGRYISIIDYDELVGGMRGRYQSDAHGLLTGRSP